MANVPRITSFGSWRAALLTHEPRACEESSRSLNDGWRHMNDRVLRRKTRVWLGLMSLLALTALVGCGGDVPPTGGKKDAAPAADARGRDSTGEATDAAPDG